MDATAFTGLPCPASKTSKSFSAAERAMHHTSEPASKHWQLHDLLTANVVRQSAASYTLRVASSALSVRCDGRAVSEFRGSSARGPHLGLLWYGRFAALSTLVLVPTDVAGTLDSQPAALLWLWWRIVYW